MTAHIIWDARKARDFGIGRYVTSLLAALARRGTFRLSAIAFPEDRELLPESVDLLPCRAPHYSLREVISVGRILSGTPHDLFHAPHYVTPAAPFGGRPMVVTVHDLMHLSRPEHASPAKRLYARTMIGRALDGAARVIAVSEATRDEIGAFRSPQLSKVRVVPNGVDDRFLGEIPAADRERVRKTHGLDTPYVLFLGNDKPHKNLTRLVQAFETLPPTHGLVLAGGATARTGGVHALGRVPEADLPALLAEATALALPSLAEGFGLPVLEAQAAGTPVLCSRRGGLAEAAGEAAVFVDPESVDSIAEGLTRLLGDAALRGRLSAEGRAHARRFTWDAAAEATAAVYEEALGETAGT